MDCGFQIFTKKHLPFLTKLKEFYFNNNDKVLELQAKVGRGTDQPVYNYLLQKENIDFSSLIYKDLVNLFIRTCIQNQLVRSQNRKQT